MIMTYLYDTYSNENELHYSQYSCNSFCKYHRLTDCISFSHVILCSRSASLLDSRLPESCPIPTPSYKTVKNREINRSLGYLKMILSLMITWVVINSKIC